LPLAHETLDFLSTRGAGESSDGRISKVQTGGSVAAAFDDEKRLAGHVERQVMRQVKTDAMTGDDSLAAFEEAAIDADADAAGVEEREGPASLLLVPSDKQTAQSFDADTEFIGEDGETLGTSLEVTASLGSVVLDLAAVDADFVLMMRSMVSLRIEDVEPSGIPVTDAAFDAGADAERRVLRVILRDHAPVWTMTERT